MSDTGSIVSSRFQTSPDTIATRVGDEIVLVHLKTDRIYVLNRTGARLWELLAADCERQEILRRMLAEFAVAPAELERELDGWLATLTADSLIRVRQ